MAQSSLAALEGIITFLDNYRAQALEQARQDYIAEHGQWNADQEVDGQFYPANGPTIPSCALDDPSDIRFVEGRIYRRLTLYRDNVRALQYVGGNSGGEPEHVHQLEWTVLAANSEAESRKAVFEGGIKDIEQALVPLIGSYLKDPEDSNKNLAISFTIPSVDYQTHDVGDHTVQAAFIALQFTLNAPSVLS